ncbi:MAG TPA: hypothetical protein VK158_04355 [Acidobacteriota bacterium]|nr:hypothetical protein [Acidobacteriota bacterium]
MKKTAPKKAKQARKAKVEKHVVSAKHEEKHANTHDASHATAHDSTHVAKHAKPDTNEEPMQDTPLEQTVAPLSTEKADKYPIPPEDPSYHPPKEHHHVILIVSVIVIIVVAAIIAFTGMPEKLSPTPEPAQLRERIVTVEKTIQEQVPLIPDLTTYIEDVESYDRQNIQTIGFAKYVKDGSGTIVVATPILTDAFGNEIKLEKIPKSYMDLMRDDELLVNVSGVYYRFSGDTINRPRLVLSSISVIDAPFILVEKTILVNETVME